MFVWHGLRKQVAAWARACISCQASRVERHVRTPLQDFVVPSHRSAYTHVDLVGPLPLSRDANHLLTVVDRFTQWPEAVPLSDTSAANCARALVAHRVARFSELLTFLLIMVPSSPLPCGRPWLSCMVRSSIIPPRITLRPTGWSKGSTDI